jgi:hypothetical protein
LLKGEAPKKALFLHQQKMLLSIARSFNGSEILTGSEKGAFFVSNSFRNIRTCSSSLDFLHFLFSSLGIQSSQAVIALLRAHSDEKIAVGSAFFVTVLI